MTHSLLLMFSPQRLRVRWRAAAATARKRWRQRVDGQALLEAAVAAAPKTEAGERSLGEVREGPGVAGRCTSSENRSNVEPAGKRNAVEMPEC